MLGRKILLIFVLMLAAVAALNVTAGSWGETHLYRKDYDRINGYYADIYYGAGCEDYGKAAIRITDTYYPYLMKEFGVSEKARPEIVIHPDKEHMYAAMGRDYGEKPPMGAYSGGVIQVLSPECWAEREADFIERFMEKGPLIHELAHFLLDKKTGGNYEIWFSEGVALYMEYKYIAFEWQAQAEDGAKISLAQMKDYFISSKQASAYRMAFEQVKKLVDTYGENALLDIYNELAEGISFMAVIDNY